jgi:hypothetical protein
MSSFSACAVIGCASGPAGRTFDNISANLHLADTQGHAPSSGIGGGTGVQGDQNGNVMAFDAGGMVSAGQVFHLRLTVPAISANETVAGSPAAVACESYAPAQSSGAETRSVAW